MTSTKTSQNKNFNQILKRQQLFKNQEDYRSLKTQKLDPYVYVTPQVAEQILEGNISRAFVIVMGAGFANIVLAPLQTISASLQLSVKKHKDIYITPEARTKQLARLNTQLTIAEKRQIQLMIRSGGDFRPYTAPVYEGYKHTIKNLAKQGWRAFFKGVTFRLFHSTVHMFGYLKFLEYANIVNKCDPGQLLKASLMSYGIMCFFDFCMNGFHILENRYILQNNIREFRVFRNPLKTFAKMVLRKQIFVGLPYHMLVNIPQVIFKFQIYYLITQRQIFNIDMAFIYYLTEFLSYPLNTAFRRLTCQVTLNSNNFQSTTIPGMIPLRYNGLVHALRLIKQEQGVKGLWKGFGLHNVNIMAKLSIIIAFCTVFKIDSESSGFSQWV